MQDIPAKAAWIRFPRFMGDAVMIHAALEPLRAAGIPLVPWGREWVVDLFSEAPGYCAAVSDEGLRPGLLETVRMLRRHRPSCVINLSRSQRATLAAFLAFVPRRIAWAESGGRILATRWLDFQDLEGTKAERNRLLMRSAFPELPEAPFVPFRPRAQALEARDRTLAGFPELSRGYLGINIGAASPNKRPAPDFLVALGHLARQSGMGTVVFGGTPVEAEAARPVIAALPGSLDCTGPMPLAERAAWIAGSRAFVTGDTGYAHLAAAAGVPTLVLFGPTTPSGFLPAGPRVEAIVAEGLDCIGCGGCLCPFPEIPCMKQFKPQEVWDRVEHLLTPSIHREQA
jgi:heptosyltransferase-2